MLNFEFIVPGPPVSQQTQDRVRLQAWKETVRAAAKVNWPNGASPSAEKLQITVVYFHDAITIRMDNDNMVKPIQDALKEMIYVDDRQITDTQVRKTNLDGEFRVKGMSRVLAEGFCLGQEFIYIRVESAPDHAELL